MKYNPDADQFRQEVHFQVVPSEPVNGANLIRLMGSLGFRLYHDVLAVPRREKSPVWQSETFANVDVYLGGKRVPATQGADSLIVSYPLATLDASCVPVFAQLISQVAGVLGGCIKYRGRFVDEIEVNSILSGLVLEVESAWGECVGSRELRVFIETMR